MSRQVMTMEELMLEGLALPATERWGTLTVDDEANSPTLNPGDMVAVDLSVNWQFDGMYVVEIDGQPLIRRVMMQIDGLRVFADNPEYGETCRGVAVDDLKVLGRVCRSAGWKSLALPACYGRESQG